MQVCACEASLGVSTHVSLRLTYPCSPRTRKRRRDEPPQLQRDQSQLNKLVKSAPLSIPIPLTASAEQTLTRAELIDSTISVPPGRANSSNTARPHSNPEEAPWPPARFDLEQYYTQNIYSQASVEVTLETPDDRQQSRPALTSFKTHAVSDLPSRVWTSTLIGNWLDYVHPLMPIVPQRWLTPREGYDVPIVLFKAVLLSGGRNSGSFPAATCEEYYLAVKEMLHHHLEKNPIINIVAACLLGWYNQATVWSVAHDSSRYWLHFASNIAYQISLHRESVNEAHLAYKRKLWWTLVVCGRSYRHHIRCLMYSIGKRLLSGIRSR